MDKLIIAVGITGSRITREQTPYIPITPEEIAESGIAAWGAGASILHVHVRDPKTGLGTQDNALFREVLDRLREKTDAIVSLTTSGIPGRNLPTEERLRPLELRPDMASFDAGSINVGQNVFINGPDFLETLAKETAMRGIRPEVGVFEVGMLCTCLRFLQRGLFRPPLYVQFALGAQGAMPATPKSLLHLVELLPEDTRWGVIENTGGEMRLALMALAMGGHVRVGLEESIYLRQGVLAKSNAEHVERVVRIAHECGREVASAKEAREMLGLGGPLR